MLTVQNNICVICIKATQPCHLVIADKLVSSIFVRQWRLVKTASFGALGMIDVDNDP